MRGQNVPPTAAAVSAKVGVNRINEEQSTGSVTGQLTPVIPSLQLRGIRHQSGHRPVNNRNASSGLVQPLAAA